MPHQRAIENALPVGTLDRNVHVHSDVDRPLDVHRGLQIDLVAPVLDAKERPDKCGGFKSFLCTLVSVQRRDEVGPGIARASGAVAVWSGWDVERRWSIRGTVSSIV